MSTGSFRRLLPWASALALLALALSRAPVGAAWQGLRAADYLHYLAVAVPFVALWLALDSLALARLVTRFHRRVPFRELLPLRGATYLFMAFSYDAAQAALALALQRRYALPLAALGGTFLFYYAVDLCSIGAVASLGARSLPGAIGAGLRLALGLLLASVAAGLALLAGLARAPAARVPGWLRGTQLLDTLRVARLRDFAEFAAWRTLFYLSFVAFHAAALPAFDIEVPVTALVGLVPVVMSLAALPITVAGVGSTQVAMLVLFAPYTEPGRLLAWSLVYTATLVLLRLPIGLLCWPAAAGAVRGEVTPNAALAARRSER